MFRLNINDINATFKGSAAYLLKRRFGPFRQQRKWLNRTQWYSEHELKQLQLSLLKRTVTHAWETVGYYHNLMNSAGLKPCHIQSLSDITKFPITTKDDLKSAGLDMVSRKFSKRFLRTAHTGGTTGLPVPLKRDLHSIGNEHAFVRRQFDWAGIRLSDRSAYLTWRKVVPAGRKTARAYAYDAAMKELILSTFHLCQETAITYARAVKNYNITALVAYPSAAFILAKCCLEEGFNLPLKAVLTTAETLDIARRRIISEAFKCPVYDFYGCAERVCYIHTCPQGSYHIVPEYGLTELLPAEGPNRNCRRIVATGFWNMAMPLIRYDIGDLVIPSGGKCLCERDFPVIEKILGRESKPIVTNGGKILGATAIECILAQILYGTYQMPVIATQVIYLPDGKLRLEYVPATNFSQKDAQNLRMILTRELPEDTSFEIQRTDSITKTPAGKHLSFVMAQYH